LLDHRHVEGAAQPDYCDDPVLLLGKIKTAVQADDAAGKSRCTANSLSDADGTSLLRISCPLDQSPNGCGDYYMGQLWTEKYSGSTKDFLLRGYGWVRRVCRSGAYDASKVRDTKQHMSASFHELLSPCDAS
jgi:hypothetical protein